MVASRATNVRSETVRSCGAGSALVGLGCRCRKGFAYYYKCPWDVYVLDVEIVAEEDEDARDDDGGYELGESEEVEWERRVVGRLFREPVSGHGDTLPLEPRS